MKLWLDDVRPAPFGWKWVKTAREAIMFINSGHVIEISLDHDLGDDKETGYDVAKFIEKEAYLHRILPIKWYIHSANPVGVKNMEVALRNADRYWNFIS